MLKKLILTALFSLGAMTVSQALVIDGHQENVNLDLTYPLVYVENQEAQNKINTDIASYVLQHKGLYDSGQVYSASMSYKTAYEDDDFLSLLIIPYYYHAGAAHGFSYPVGIVYNKHTGDAVPISYFIRIKDEDQLMDALISRVITFSTDSNGIINDINEYPRNIDTIAQSYVLNGNGSLSLLYEPYSLGPYSMGITRLNFSREAVDYFNRMNSDWPENTISPQ